MTRSPHKRRKIIVDRKFQVGMTARFISWLGFYLLTFLLIALTAPLVVALLYDPGAASVFSVSQDIFFLLRKMAVPLVLTGLCMVVHCIVLLHRVSGPVYRLKKRLADLGEGDLATEVRLRDGDYLEDLAVGVNGAISALKADLREARDEAEGLLAEARVLANCDAVEPADLAPVVLRAERLRAVLGRFRTGAEQETAPEREEERIPSGSPA